MLLASALNGWMEHSSLRAAPADMRFGAQLSSGKGDSELMLLFHEDLSELSLIRNTVTNNKLRGELLTEI